METTATISRDSVEGWFDNFQCECIAWSPNGGEIKSRTATVKNACKYSMHVFRINMVNAISSVVDLKKHSFVTSPLSARLEPGSKIEIKCTPPSGFPKPKISWMKNNDILMETSSIAFTKEGHLLIHGAKAQVNSFAYRLNSLTAMILSIYFLGHCQLHLCGRECGS